MNAKTKKVLFIVGGGVIGFLYIISVYILEAAFNCRFLSDSSTCTNPIFNIYIPLYTMIWIPFGLLIFPVIGLLLGILAARGVAKNGEFMPGYSKPRLVTIYGFIALVVVLYFITM